MLDMRIVLAVGLGIIAVAAGVTLSKSPAAVLRSNSVPEEESLRATSTGDFRICQSNEHVPQGTSSIEVSVEAAIGPSLQIEVYSREGIVTSGQLGAGWSGRSVPISVKRVRHAAAPVEVCLTSNRADEPISIAGSRSSASGQAEVDGQPIGGRMTIVYLGAGRASWLERAGSVARHMAFGRAWPGTWIAPFLLALAIAITIVAAFLTGGAAARRSVAASAWLCALAACLSAIGWSFITPPFQVPDEPSHIAYVKQLSDTGSLPSSRGEQFSEEEQLAIGGLDADAIRFDAARKAIFSARQQDQLDEALRSLASSSKKGSPDAGVAASQPPLYYALESVPYRLGSGGTLLERVQLMRLLSALIAGLTALFSLLFLRELLPTLGSAATVGALGVALSPLLGFISGGVNPDSLLFAVSAAAFYFLARAFRRGLGPRESVAIGAVTAIGLLTKLTFIGLVPGILLGLLLLSIRAAKLSGRSAYRLLALALAIAFSPVALYAAINELSNRPELGAVSGAGRAASRSLLAEINYVWQLYLPHLPGTVNDFRGLFTAREIWFDGYVGQLGWLDTFFPTWVYGLASILAGLILTLCVVELARGRHALRRRLPELATYALMTLGLMALIGAASFTAFPGQSAGFGQARYLLPLLPLLGAVLALASRGAGRRFSPAVGALLVSLFLAHDLFSQLQVIARYYG